MNKNELNRIDHWESDINFKKRLSKYVISILSVMFTLGTINYYLTEATPNFAYNLFYCSLFLYALLSWLIFQPQYLVYQIRVLGLFLLAMPMIGWFQVAGYNGSAPIVMLIFTGIMSQLLRAQYFRLFILIMVLEFIGMSLMQFYQIKIPIDYANETAEFADKLFIFSIAIIIIGLVFLEYSKKRFIQLTELKELNEELVVSEEEIKSNHESLQETLEALDDKNKELEKERLLLETTQAMSKVGYWEYDVQTNKTWFSKEVSVIYGLPIGEVPPIEEGMDYYPDSAKETISELVEKAISLGEEYDVVLPFLKEKKDLIWVRTMGKPEYEDGSVVKLFGTFQDVTDQKQQEEIKQKAELLGRSNQYKSDFLAQMSHEIRTPMNGIVGLLDVFESAGSLNEEQEKYINSIKESADDLMLLVNDVLNISKIESGIVQLINKENAIQDLISKSKLLYEGKAKSKGLKFDFVVDESLPSAIKMDGIRFGQVLNNLISNAVKYTDEGSVMIYFTLISADRMKVNVKDTGAGIKKEEQGQLFTKFYQAASSLVKIYDGSERGTGLGLDICKGLVELMGGEIGVESEKGEGSDFWFEIPFEPVEEHLRSEEVIKEKRGIKMHKLNVLVAEDKKVNQMVIGMMLKKLACEYTVVENGEEAIKEATKASSNYDVILMDIQMPKMDGITATVEIRKNLKEHTPDILMLSAQSSSNYDHKKDEIGYTAFLEKPIKLEQLNKAFWMLREKGSSNVV